MQAPLAPLFILEWQFYFEFLCLFSESFPLCTSFCTEIPWDFSFIRGGSRSLGTVTNIFLKCNRIYIFLWVMCECTCRVCAHAEWASPCHICPYMGICISCDELMCMLWHAERGICAKMPVPNAHADRAKRLITWLRHSWYGFYSKCFLVSEAAHTEFAAPRVPTSLPLHEDQRKLLHVFATLQFMHALQKTAG